MKIVIDIDEKDVEGEKHVIIGTNYLISALGSEAD